MDRRGKLLEILRRAQTQGFLGAGDVADHVSHAVGFAGAARRLLPAEPTRFADLGTGGGVPGLVLGVEWEAAEGVLIESSARRCRALEEWTGELGLAGRIQVLEVRAEEAARIPELRESFDLVTARSFARPAVTAEIASGLVRISGFLLVSEPPTPDPGRWPDSGLEGLGFDPAVQIAEQGAHYAGCRKMQAAAAGIPRAIGKPGKRPLW